MLVETAPSGHGDRQTTVVLNEIFVGRRDELARFTALLRELTEVKGTGRRRWRHPQLSGDDPAAMTSRVVLVHGLGGSGKSRLLRHFREMAQGAVPGSPVSTGKLRTAWLDWEDEQRNDPGRYTAIEGPSLVTVLDAVQNAVIDAFWHDANAAGRASQAFAGYREGAARAPEYAARFPDVLAQSNQAGSPFTSADAGVLLKAAASAGLVAAGHPAGVMSLTPDKIAAAAQAGGHLSAAATRAITGKKPGDVSPQEYNLVTDPGRELARRAAAAVLTAAGRVPLVIFLDTGEVIGDRAWGWLRGVMTRTGDRVAWVVGARFETEAEAGIDSPIAHFVRDIGDERLVLMSPTRFDDAMIRAYLQSRPDASSYTDAQIDTIAAFTRGLPLAVSLTATLLNQGQAVQDVCREMDEGHPSSVISQLARRYLKHAEQHTYPTEDPRHDDVTKILGLALAFADLRNDPAMLAALWNVDDPLAAFQDLARRHDFVLPASRRLHDDVRDTLRTDLLDPYRRSRARQINQRALDLLYTRIEQMRSRWRTLDEQLAHPGFTTAILATLWHTLWADDKVGLDLFTQIIPVLAVADRSTAGAAANLIEQFTSTFSQDQKNDLDLLTKSGSVGIELRPGEDWRSKIEAHLGQRRRVKITLAGLALKPSGLAEASPLIGERSDRDVALMILRASLQAIDLDDMGPVETLKIANSVTSSDRYRSAIIGQIAAITSLRTWTGPAGTAAPSDVGLAAARLGTHLDPGSADM